METILLIHPDPVLRDKLTLILQDSGFQVAGVSGGQEALAGISSVCPDLIVLAESDHRLNGNEPRGYYLPGFIHCCVALRGIMLIVWVRGWSTNVRVKGYHSGKQRSKRA